MLSSLVTLAVALVSVGQGGYPTGGGGGSYPPNFTPATNEVFGASWSAESRGAPGIKGIYAFSQVTKLTPGFAHQGFSILEYESANGAQWNSAGVGRPCNIASNVVGSLLETGPGYFGVGTWKVRQAFYAPNDAGINVLVGKSPTATLVINAAGDITNKDLSKTGEGLTTPGFWNMSSPRTTP
jgi:hypothetical protein